MSTRSGATAREDRPGARAHERRAAWPLVALLLAVGCGRPADRAPDAAASGPTGASGAHRTAAAAAASPGNHATYAQNGLTCAECHPCGQRIAGGHGADWMDQASAGFHAVAANAGLAACQTCHGAALDGVGGTTTVSCARCHGATWRTSCTGCHGGTDSTTGAPPRATWAHAADAVRVGAHTAHLGATHGLAAPVACGACHTVPADALSAGHVDGGTAEVIFGGLAVSGGATPTWARATATCSNVYCHGGTLGAGGTATAPTWTAAAGAQSTCASCHGAPPPSPHPANGACGSCHAGYTATSVNVATHINGTVDVVAMTCTSCHGDATRAATTLNPQLAAAPPVGTHAETATTTRAVGAHQAHLNAGAYANALACTECHAVPTSTSHENGAVDLAWGTLARTGGATPSWNGTTCTNYCHGSTLAAGGTNTAPSWTGGAAEAACGTCHGAPPPSPHPANGTCGSCHTGYTATTVNAATHLNGTVDVIAMTCTSCHGDATRAATTLNPQLAAAPPVGTHGETATTTRAVGAHQAHLNAGAYANALACTECHAVPTSTSHENGAVNLAWGTLARTGGATPSWNGTTCTNYCHGSTLAAGGTDTAPTWTGGAAEAACGTCHGAPPPSPHSASTACGSCHTGYTATSVNLATHLNGTVDVVAMTCTSCHGDATRAATTLNPQLPAAPPVGTRGETATTARAVGAHQAHLAGTTISNGVACTECHTVPTSTSHANGTALVTFGTLARTSSSAATWNTATLTCSATWCHGARLTGGTNTAPSWTRVDGTQDACGTCHGRPPTSGRHTSVSRHRSASCGTCHGGTYSSTVADRALHFNGRFDMSTAANIGWVASSRTCTASLTGCHGGSRKTW